MTFSTPPSSPSLHSGTIQSVTELTQSIKLILENGFSFISVCGEVSNIRKPYSGHIYFTLKDDSSQLKAVLFKTQQRYLSRELSHGDTVICRGRISVYDARGEYQIIVDSVEYAGEGDLQLAFEQLKKKLSAEGLFDNEHKKNIPFFPRSIALITSPTGAAVHDFLKRVESRFASLPIEIYPVRVQGDEAAKEIISAVQEANKRNTSDVIVICRGGGSIEDLWPFNNEDLARSVFHSSLPVVSAIGHEIDFTILDFVADMRAPTPSTAAELVVPSQSDLKNTIDHLQNSLVASMNFRINELRHTISLQERLIKDPTALLQNFRLRIDQLQNSLIYSLKSKYIRCSQKLQKDIDTLNYYSPQHKINADKNRIEKIQKSAINSFQHMILLKKAQTQNAAAILTAVNPKAVLQRGYSVVYTVPEDTIVSSSKQVKAGDKLRIQTNSGTISSQVTKTS